MTEETSSVPEVQAGVIHIIDDDQGFRSSLEDLFASVGYDVASYATTRDFLISGQPHRPGCLILDVRLPGVNGLEFQEQLRREGWTLPIILVSGFGDVPMSVRGMKGGASDFIEKPFRDQDLLDAVVHALEEGRRRFAQNARFLDAQNRFRALTPRERDIIKLVVEGRLSKQIAHELSISEVTVKIHRASAMKKLRASSIVELIRLAEAIGL